MCPGSCASVFAILAMTTVGEARQAGAPLAPTLLPAAVVGANVTLSVDRKSSRESGDSYGSRPAVRRDCPTSHLLTVGPTPTVFNAVAPAGTYYVRVIALNAGGASAPSNEVVVVVGGGGACVIPGPPTGLQAALTPGGVSLQWNAPSVGGVPTGYTLLVGSAAGQLNIGVFQLGPATSLSSPAPAGTYFVRVVAVNACGSSAPSTEVFFTIGAPAGPLQRTGGQLSRQCLQLQQARGRAHHRLESAARSADTRDECVSTHLGTLGR